MDLDFDSGFLSLLKIRCRGLGIPKKGRPVVKKGWIVAQFKDWVRDAGGHAPCEDVPCEDVSLFDKDEIRAVSQLRAEVPDTGLGDIEFELYELKQAIDRLNQEEAWLAARRNRRLTEAKTDKAELSDWGLSPRMVEKYTAAAKRYAKRLDALADQRSKLFRQRADLERRLRARETELEEEIEALLARSDETREMALAINPKAERLHRRPYSVGQS